MYLYNKTMKHKNTAGKITALLLLLAGAAVFIMASNLTESFVSIIQFIGVILIGISVYIATAYLLREYTFSVSQANLKGGESFAESFDLIVYEKKNNRDVKACHFSMSDLTRVTVVDPKNKKQIAKERKNMKCYTYNTQFAASRYIEVRATLTDEDYSILLTYDDELLRVLNDFFREEF